MKRTADGPPLLALLVPCYNEEEIIAETAGILADKLESWKQEGLISPESFCCFVDDGSQDRTWELLEAAEGDFACLKLTHNVGHQSALFAGLKYLAGKVDCCISLDCDLQDDVDAIPEMLKLYGQGKDIVYGVRSARDVDPFHKRHIASWYYRLAHRLGIAGIPNHADFRLMSRRALMIIQQFQEGSIYLRGLIPLLNLPSSKVHYTRKRRLGGTSKYTLGKLVKLALDGITSFSVAPLRLISLLGFAIFLISLLLGIRHIVNHYFYGQAVPGWASLIVSVYFLGGLIMLSLGVIGEYLAKIFIESKKRPVYVVEEVREQGIPDGQPRGSNEHTEETA